MTDDLLTRLRHLQEWGSIAAEEAADRIEELQETIARIEYTNLRRDMNIKNRTLEIDKLCKTTKKV